MTIKNAVYYLNDPSKKEKPIKRPVDKILLQWAQEAHEIDNSKSIKEYFELFLARYNQDYVTKKDKDVFFGEEAIDT